MTRVQPWPNDKLVGMIEEAFGYLIRDYGFISTIAERLTVAYDQIFMSSLTRIAIGVDAESLLVDVDISWPDEKTPGNDLEPVISLVDVVAMRAPNVDLPRDTSTEQAAERTVGRSAELLRELAVDILSGGQGLL